jgi:hypothetical protein
MLALPTNAVPVHVCASKFPESAHELTEGCAPPPAAIGSAVLTKIIMPLDLCCQLSTDQLCSLTEAVVLLLWHHLVVHDSDLLAVVCIAVVLCQRACYINQGP